MSRTLIVLLIAAVTGSLLNGYYWHERFNKEKGRANELKNLAQERAETITEMQIRQRDAAELDAQHTRELNNALAENSLLQRRLDAGGGVRVQGRCPVQKRKPAASGSMGDDRTVELSHAAGRNVLDIRAGIISDQQKLRYLQEYVRTQCTK